MNIKLRILLITIFFFTNFQPLTTGNDNPNKSLSHQEKPLGSVKLVSHLTWNESDKNSGTSSIPYSPQTTLSFIDVEVHGNYVYLLDDNATLWLVSIQDIQHPTIVSHIGVPNLCRGISSDNNLVFVANNDGLAIIDVSNPLKPKLVSTTPTMGRAFGVDVQGQYAYSAIQYPEYGLEITDISNPTYPVRMSYTAQCYICNSQAVTVKGQYAYLAQNFDGVSIYDVTNPGSPSKQSHYYVHGYAQNIALGGRYVLTAYKNYNSGGGLQIEDVKTFSNPQEASTSYTPGFGEDVLVIGNNIYLANGSSGLRIFEVIDPTNPEVLGMTLTNGEAHALAAEGRYLFLASGQGGLYIFDIGYNRYSIKGRVVDVQGKPIRDLILSINPMIEAVTDTNGFFEFVGIPEGNYSLTPELQGLFKPATRQVLLTQDLTGQDFILVAKPVTTTLQPGISTTIGYTDSQGLWTNVEFPVGAVNETTDITLFPDQSAGFSGFAYAGHAFRVSASNGGIEIPNFYFNKPITATIQFSNADTAVITDSSKLTLLRWNGQWQDLHLSSNCNAPPPISGANQLVSPFCETGKYGLFGPTFSFFLPSVWR
jgi:hypothetical protein